MYIYAAWCSSCQQSVSATLLTFKTAKQKTILKVRCFHTTPKKRQRNNWGDSTPIMFYSYPLSFFSSFFFFLFPFLRYASTISRLIFWKIPHVNHSFWQIETEGSSWKSKVAWNLARESELFDHTSTGCMLFDGSPSEQLFLRPWESSTKGSPFFSVSYF